VAQLAAVPVVVNSVAPAQAQADAADDGAFDLVLAALTPDLAAPQAPAAVPLPKTRGIEAAPEPAPKDADIVKLLPRPVPAARADAKPPAPAKLAAPKIEASSIKPVIPPSTDDKDGVAAAPLRVVADLMTKPANLAVAVAETAKPAVVEAPPAPPPVEAPVPVAVQVKPDAKPAPDKAPRAAPQPIVQDATPVQEIEHDTSASQEQEHQGPEPTPQQQPHQPPAPAHQAVQVPTATNVAHLPTSVAAPAPERATAHSDPQPDIKALAAQIVAKAASGAKTFEIRLDPPELGRVEVHLTVSHDGKAEATLTAERPETVALLQRDSQNLERTLKEAGLDVSNSSLNFSLKGEERQGDGGGASRAHTRNLSDAVVARSETVNASLANRSSAPSSARLDIFV